MSRGRQAALSGGWTALASAMGAALVALLPSLLSATADPSRTMAVAVLALALAAVATYGSLRLVLALGTASPVPTPCDVAPVPRCGPVTDPAHHPLRPRAPGPA